MTYEFMVNQTASWNQFLSGDFFGAILSTYTNVWGLSFYMIICFMAMVMIYLKTDNFGTTVITGLVISGVAIAYMPASTGLIIIGMIGMGVAILLYKIWH